MRCSKAFTPLVTGLTMVALSTEALAAPDDEDVKEAPRRHRSSEVLIRMEEPRGETRSWLEEHVSVRKGMGLAYYYKVPTEGDRKVILSVGGPALKHNRLGAMFEVKF
jgi:hypothetical protein